MPIEADTTIQTAESESLSLGLHEELVAKAHADGADIRPGLPANPQPLVAQGAPAVPSSRWPVFPEGGATEVGSITNALHVRKCDRHDLLKPDAFEDLWLVVAYEVQP